MTTEVDIDKPVYSISSAARLVGISVHTLRMYEKEKLIIPYKVGHQNRLYSQRDIDRILCIRNSIKEKKFSINSMKAMLSLIPCWSLRNCPENERENCEAYNQAQIPCWSFEHKGNSCGDQQCRVCTVYNLFKCDQIKEAIKNSSR